MCLEYSILGDENQNMKGARSLWRIRKASEAVRVGGERPATVARGGRGTGADKEADEVHRGFTDWRECQTWSSAEPATTCDVRDREEWWHHQVWTETVA